MNYFHDISYCALLMMVIFAYVRDGVNTRVNNMLEIASFFLNSTYSCIYACSRLYLTHSLPSPMCLNA